MSSVQMLYKIETKIKVSRKVKLVLYGEPRCSLAQGGGQLKLRHGAGT